MGGKEGGREEGGREGRRRGGREKGGGEEGEGEGEESSWIVLDNATYSASAVDKATVSCFLLLHDTGAPAI